MLYLCGDLTGLVNLSTHLILRARLEVTAIVLILNTLHFRIYCAQTRLNFDVFFFKLSGIAAEIGLVLHAFARLFFISVPVGQQVVHDFLNGVKRSGCVLRVRALLIVALSNQSRVVLKLSYTEAGIMGRGRLI